MKKRIIASLAILAVFGLAIAAYAYNQTSNTIGTKASCCKKRDSCPMKTKGEKPQTVSVGMKNVTVVSSDENCCCCCGNSCPMKKEGAARTVAASSEDGKNCCEDCDCCKGKHETAV